MGRDNEDRAEAPVARSKTAAAQNLEHENETPAGPLQTLDRGLRALNAIASRPSGLPILELADELDVHRAIAYRIVATLEAHGLVMRGAKGMLRLGPGLLTLAARFEPQLRDVVQPVLERLANETGASAFLSVPQGGDCVAVLVAESPTAILRVAYRIGSRHPLTRGAAGIAILSGRPEHPSDPDDVRLARANGFSVTHGQLQQGAVGVACPLHGPSSGKSFTEASIGVVTLDDAHIGKLTEAVLGAARELRRNLGGASG